MGIAHRNLPQLFQKFARGTEKAVQIKGTCLGLYFARIVMENMLGRILGLERSP